ncbi:PilZ domain-containing protein [Candidatus Omnitrophota bacterium]
MPEKRQFSRFNAKLSVAVKILDAKSNLNITNDFDALTQDISKNGLRLMLPRSWNCAECNNCLGWTYNKECKLINDPAADDNRCFAPGSKIRIIFNDPSIPTAESITLQGELVWANPNLAPQEDTYPAGVALSRKAQKIISTYLSNAQNPSAK